MSTTQEQATYYTLKYRALYYQLLGKGKPLKVIEHLRTQLPVFEAELLVLRTHFYQIRQKTTRGTISREDASVEHNKITQALIAFINALSKGEVKSAASYLVIGDKMNGPIGEVINGQLSFSQKSIRENKILRTAVGTLFLFAIICSGAVVYNHFPFLKGELKVIGLLTASTLLYVLIGFLALYALSLIIRGFMMNQSALNSTKNILKF